MTNVKILNTLFLCALLIFASCGGDSGNKIAKNGNGSDGADPSVSAELGGNGFTGEGWETTASDFEPQGDPKAKKGGSFTMVQDEFPPTYRTEGKDTRHQILSMIEGMVYEGLLTLDSKTLKYNSALATHWKISEDKTTYTFRIDPNARWSDGKPVVAEDVVATYKLLVDKGIEDPSTNGTYEENYELPVAESKYIVSVKCKKVNWRSFIYFSTRVIFPSHHLNKIDGKGYLTKYQFQMMPGSGAYVLDQDATKKGEVLVLKRRKDYWAENYQANIGLNNFDEIRFVFVLDDRLQLEKFKKGEFDFYMPSRAQWWVQELDPTNVDEISRGLIQKRKIFNYKPLGMSGLAYNTLEEPFNDIRVRKAFGMLWNVDQLIEKLFFGEYERCRSYFQGSIYENPKNPLPVYDPDQAVKLLAEAGWTKKAGQKYLTKNGKNFELDFMIDQSWERIFTPFQQDLEKVGIKLSLVNVTPQAKFEQVMGKKFKVTHQGWTGLVFPNPETSLHSKYSKEVETNNITGMANKRIDEICDIYDKTYEISERVKLMQELDAIAVSEENYSFGWVAPYGSRIAFWNKFGMPESGLTYSGDWVVVPTLWWYDADKDKALQEAKTDKNKKLEVPPMIVDYWNKRNAVAQK
ncbi:hypothetical protein IT568_10410 [bacterium]|nr:hypothetical protein [bacterium]